jgi:hypothetical protein
VPADQPTLDELREAWPEPTTVCGHSNQPDACPYCLARALFVIAERQREEIRVVNEHLTGDWCSECHRPQWVLPNGEHACSTFVEAQHERDAFRCCHYRLDLRRFAYAA